MTDMAPGLGATASCPKCGAQVQVTNVDASAVRCPDCGALVETGVRDEVATDITPEELIRAFGVNGYDVEVRPSGDGLRCESCGAERAAKEWGVDDVRRGGPPEAVVAALRCPSCRAHGTLVLDHLDDEHDARLVRAIERNAA